MPAGGLVTLGAIGLTETAIGLIKSSKAKKEAKALAASRPQYKESPYYKQGLSQAESELSTGMSGEAKNAYEQGIDRNLSTSLNAILKGGGSTNNIAEAFDTANQGRQKLAIMKDNLRLNNISNLQRAQQASSEEREKAFQFNQWAPWADAAKANAGAKEQAQNEIYGGINTVGSGVIGAAGTAAGSKALNSLFGSGQTPAATSGSGVTGSGSAVQLANTYGAAPDTSNIVGPYISPTAPNLNTNFSPDYNQGLPDMSTLE